MIAQSLSQMNQKDTPNETLLNDVALVHGIADAAPGMLYVIDLRDMKMVYANQKVLSLFGRSLAELGEMGPALFDEYVFAEDRPRFDEHIAELLSAAIGEVKELTFRLLDVKRQPVWVCTRRTIFKRDEQGNPTHVISVSQDISKEVELKQIRDELEAEKRRLMEERQLEIFKATLAAQEEERRRISESLHNGLGQLLYGVKLSLSTLTLESPTTFMQTRGYVFELLEEGIREARKISHQLMPTVLHDFGIKAAIEDVCKKMNSKVYFSLEFKGLERLVPKYIELAIFRIVQELIHNIGKHAEANVGKVCLKADENLICIEVADNGIGFNPKDHRSDGIGLKSMYDKITLLKGQMAIESSGNGTIVSISIPHPNFRENKLYDTA